MEHGREDADAVQERRQDRLQRRGGRAGRVVRVEVPSTKRLSQPVQLHDVPDDEREGDHARRPLERVADVADVGIRADVRQAVGDDDEAHSRMKQHRQKDEGPLDRHEERAQGVDHVHPRLERSAIVTGENRGVRQQVNDQKRADRNKSGERKQPIDQKLVAFQERRG